MKRLKLKIPAGVNQVFISEIFKDWSSYLPDQKTVTIPDKSHHFPAASVVRCRPYTAGTEHLKDYEVTR